MFSKLRLLMMGGLILTFLFATSWTQSNHLQARSQYKGVFTDNYKAELNGKKVTCKGCHPKGTSGENKKIRNDYAKALEKELGNKKNVKDKDAVKKAMKELEKKDSIVKDKKWIDLIKDGTWPGPEKEEDEEDDK